MNPGGKRVGGVGGVGRVRGIGGVGGEITPSSLSSPPTPSSSPTSLLLLLPLTLCLVLGLVACGNQTHTANKSRVKSISPQEVDSNLNFFDVTLEQADEVGRPIWKVKAKKAKYTKEKQIGKAESPYGELYQDGKVVYQVQGQQADIKEDGKELFLQGNIIATDPHNGIVLRGNELEWRPKEDLLIVRGQTQHYPQATTGSSAGSTRKNSRTAHGLFRSSYSKLY